MEMMHLARSLCGMMGVTYAADRSWTLRDRQCGHVGRSHAGLE